MTTNTRPVLNLKAAFGFVKDEFVYLKDPWPLFFQQFVQKSAAIIDISSKSPYTANQIGTIIITGGTGISLTRGHITIALANGQAIIPISIGDRVTFASGTAKFLGS